MNHQNNQYEYQERNTYRQESDNRLLMKLDYYNYNYTVRMEYKKILNLLNSTNNQSSKFKITVLKSSLCDCSDTYILVKEAIKITGAGAGVATRNADERNK